MPAVPGTPLLPQSPPFQFPQGGYTVYGSFPGAPVGAGGGDAGLYGYGVPVPSPAGFFPFFTGPQTPLTAAPYLPGYPPSFQFPSPPTSPSGAAAASQLYFFDEVGTGYAVPAEGALVEVTDPSTQ